IMKATQQPNSDLQIVISKVTPTRLTPRGIRIRIPMMPSTSQQALASCLRPESPQVLPNSKIRGNIQTRMSIAIGILLAAATSFLRLESQQVIHHC
ncbi:hypothetical protein LTR66_014694, partial [Elasticomyces elasticus]